MVTTAKSFISCLIALICLSLPAHLLAADLSSLVNMAGMQRMLSQKITKAYFFQGERIRTRKAKKQMSASIDLFRSNHQTLLQKITDPAIQEMLVFAGTTIDEFVQTSQQPYRHNNAAHMLVLSDTLLEVSQSIVEKIEAVGNLNKVTIVNISGRQRMLSQRIAKFYIAYQAGFKDQGVTGQLMQAVEQFDEAHKQLMNNQNNSIDITRELERVDRLWKVVRGFFLDIEKGGLPVTVFTVSDSIMAHMDSVTTLYTKLAGKN